MIEYEEDSQNGAIIADIKTIQAIFFQEQRKPKLVYSK